MKSTESAKKIVAEKERIRAQKIYVLANLIGIASVVKVRVVARPNHFHEPTRYHKIPIESPFPKRGHDGQ